jgi:hypothetical protein
MTDRLIRSGRSPDDPAIAKSLKYLEGFVQSDGGIYKTGSTIQNYETGIAIMCFSAANKDGRYNNLIKAAEKYVKSIQWGARWILREWAISKIEAHIMAGNHRSVSAFTKAGFVPIGEPSPVDQISSQRKPSSDQ